MENKLFDIGAGDLCAKHTCSGKITLSSVYGRITPFYCFFLRTYHNQYMFCSTVCP